MIVATPQCARPRITMCGLALSFFSGDALQFSIPAGSPSQALVCSFCFLVCLFICWCFSITAGSLSQALVCSFCFPDCLFAYLFAGIFPLLLVTSLGLLLLFSCLFVCLFICWCLLLLFFFAFCFKIPSRACWQFPLVHGKQSGPSRVFLYNNLLAKAYST